MSKSLVGGLRDNDVSARRWGPAVERNDEREAAGTVKGAVNGGHRYGIL